MLFKDLCLSQPVLQAVENAGYHEASPVQAEAIPAVLSGKDLLVGAKTGTGKTAAFALPVLDQLLNTSSQVQPDKKVIKALVLVPTRELAQQVNNSFKKYAKGTGLRSAVAYGGVGIGPQIDQLKQGVDLLVATPGRLLDLCKKKAANLREIEFLIFDEADRMLDMGFRDEIKAVISKLPKREQKARQVMLFSATLNDRIFKFSKNLLLKPQVIEVDQRGSSADNVDQIIYNCDPARKYEITSYLIKNRGWAQVMVFSQTKQGADKLQQYLSEQGLETDVIHADRTQKQREDALSQFKSQKLKVLVATDVAARGIDIAELPAVINLEMPFKAEDYIHRIGRTGRAGSQGVAISLLIEEENYLLEAIEALIDERLPQQWLTGFEPDLSREIEIKRSNTKSAQKRRAKKRAFAKR
ncbi:DEAD/DEAH box helicase [Neptuniibacter caesariensis]|uniref:ATP-dependent RNA helicase, DEAD box family protein n=1 Tax=Neptuniibacter caesariensis TaxID=207954 RepID=A0A7U8C357_NEPCE|nr:DEAD/DEAH box helicase [Neptuniibacter caesariensis]EAR60630.1 ATP-dependent RNA helicase, DEAD box family protein [Oceanospirillum sp. MED92] [Neptuniibacter caesariensis]